MSTLDKETIKLMVKDAFNQKIEEKTSAFEDSLMGISQEDTEGLDEQLDESEDPIEEMVVYASPVGRGKKPEKINVANMRELAKLAKTGQYDSFEVETPRGRTDTVQYDVENGKLIEM